MTSQPVPSLFYTLLQRLALQISGDEELAWLMNQKTRCNATATGRTHGERLYWTVGWATPRVYSAVIVTTAAAAGQSNIAIYG